MNHKDPIGTQLKTIREARKLSVPQLSTILGIPSDRIYKWEKGLAAPKFADKQIVESWMLSKDWKNWKNVPEGNSFTGNVNQAIQEIKEWQVTIDSTLDVLIQEFAPLIAEKRGKSVAGVFSELKSDIDSRIKQRIGALKSAG